jgi:hypothetical protein
MLILRETVWRQDLQVDVARLPLGTSVRSLRISSRRDKHALAHADVVEHSEKPLDIVHVDFAFIAFAIEGDPQLELAEGSFDQYVDLSRPTALDARKVRVGDDSCLGESPLQ